MLIVEVIAEAPIEDIRTYGDMERPGSFRPQDLGIIRSQKGQEKIKRVLFNIPVPVVLHFINHQTQMRGIEQVKRHLSFNYPQRRPDRYQTIGWMTPEAVEHTYGVNLQTEPNAVNLVIIENEGAARYPLTPWIIAHRMLHAFEYISTDPTSAASPPDALTKMHSVEYNFLRFIGEYTGNYGIDEKQQKDLRRIIGYLLDTKAAREGSLNTAGEFFPEAFARLCVRGHIGLKPLIPPEQTSRALSAYQQFNAKLPEWEQRLTDSYLKMLEWGIGKIVAL